MTGVEGEVLELVALVHKQVVDAHLPEIDHVIRARTDGVFHLLQLCLQIELALLQSFEHGAGDVLAL